MSRTVSIGVDRRGQAHTLEAFVAAILLVSGLTFAIQATAVTPLSASTSNQHIENQQRAAATDVLETSVANGDLRETVLYWDPGNATADPRFAGTADGVSYYEGTVPPTALGDTLDRAFLDGRIAFNVGVRYDVGESSAHQRLVFMGTPSDNAVTATRAITVANDTNLTAPGSENRTLATVAADPDAAFYAPGVGNGPTYNVLEVRVVVWRM